MRQDNMVMILLSAIMLFASGCTSEQGIDKKKFAELDRTEQELKTFLISDKPCDVPDALLQRFASGIAAVKDKAASKAERDLITAYANLLATYRDGMLLCQFRTHLTVFPFVPKGRIYVSQELDPLVERYGLSTERHVYKPTGQYWRSIDADSITVIRENAEAQTRNIENTLKYN